MNKYNSVLIVDDSPLDRFLIEKIIHATHFASEVICASNVDEALAIIHSPQSLPDIILLDIQMPVKTGFDFLDSYIQLPEEYQKSKIIMMSSSLALEDHAKIMQYTAIRKFIPKPLNEEIFVNLEV